MKIIFHSRQRTHIRFGGAKVEKNNLEIPFEKTVYFSAAKSALHCAATSLSYVAKLAQTPVNGFSETHGVAPGTPSWEKFVDF
ncbi:MAG TPA: hypothetical protein PK228_00355 [Saprospiraceae bacterium]|nr:hypothetical protein [Saprospiraceae bacterium]